MTTNHDEQKQQKAKTNDDDDDVSLHHRLHRDLKAVDLVAEMKKAKNDDKKEEKEADKKSKGKNECS
jgi:hypothetical protein